MAIDPKLYEKYTGRRPGDAMDRFGESLAKQSARGPRGDTSIWGALNRGVYYHRITIAIIALIAVLYFLLGDTIF